MLRNISQGLGLGMVLWYNLSNGKGTLDVQEVGWVGEWTGFI
jgi:hypothetical protein